LVIDLAHAIPRTGARVSAFSLKGNRMKIVLNVRGTECVSMEKAVEIVPLKPV
jgi:hypothetical protein